MRRTGRCWRDLRNRRRRKDRTRVRTWTCRAGARGSPRRTRTRSRAFSTRPAARPIPWNRSSRKWSHDMTADAIWKLSFGLMLLIAAFALAIGARRTVALGTVLVLVPYQTIVTRYATSSVIIAYVLAT